MREEESERKKKMKVRKKQGAREMETREEGESCVVDEERDI